MSDAGDTPSGLPPPPPPDAVRRTVVLRGVPAGLFHELDVHVEDLVRELQLIVVGAGQGLRTDVDLRDLAHAVHHRIAIHRRAMADQLREAVASGQDVADAEVRVADTAIPVMRVFTGFVEEANEHSRAGRLLTAPASPDVLRLLRWIRDEVESQLQHGADPRPFVDRR